MSMDIVVSVAVFLAVGLFVYATLGFMFAEDRAVARRLKDLDSYQVAQAKEAAPILKPFRERIVSPVVRGIAGLAESVAPADLGARTDAKLTLAGRPGRLNASSFIALRIGLAAAAMAVSIGPFLVGALALKWAIVVVPGFALIAYLVPGVWLQNRIQHRQMEIGRTLPDMLDMLTISVEAGLGFDAAVAKYVKNSHGALGVEFGRALQEVQAGVSRRDALRRIVERTQVRDLTSFITAMVQAEMLGTSVSQVLHAQASEMRLRRRQHAEEEAQKLPVKQVFPVILCILPATMLVVLAPAVIMIMNLFAGN